jgi:uncharacterized OB-fold protein
MITARVWRERKQRYLNEAARCRTCGRIHFPPRQVCDACCGREFDVIRMADTGRILTYTVVHVAPPAFAQEVPYVVAILEMDDGARLMAQVADVSPEEVKIGARVRLEFRKVRQHGRTGIIAYGHKAVLTG